MDLKLGTNTIKLSKKLSLVLAFLFLISLSSCSPKRKKDTLKLGYLLNMSHAVPIVGLETNSFTNTTGQHFLAGGYLVNALITGNVDMAYIGPGPFLNAINKDIDILLLSGSSSGGNTYIISKEYLEQCDSNIKNVGVPQYGNTQDILARKYPKLFDSEDITFIAINPAEVETAFFTKAIDAAFVPEPWGSILEAKGAKNVINDRTLTLNEYPAAMLVVHKPFFKKYPKKVLRFLEEQKAVLDLVKHDKAQTVEIVQEHLEGIFKREIEAEYLDKSFDKIKFSSDINPSLLEDMMDISLKAKYIRKKTDLEKFIYQG